MVGFSTPETAAPRIREFVREVNPKGKTPIGRSLRAALVDMGALRPLPTAKLSHYQPLPLTASRYNLRGLAQLGDFDPVTFKMEVDEEKEIVQQTKEKG